MWAVHVLSDLSISSTDAVIKKADKTDTNDRTFKFSRRRFSIILHSANFSVIFHEPCTRLYDHKLMNQFLSTLPI